MNIFRNTLSARPRLNKFDLSYEHKMSLKFGQLVPTFIQEIIPGDRIKMNAEMMARLNPMLAPLFHRVNMYTHYWFVPNRIIFDKWNDFMTGGEDGEAVIAAPTLGMNDSNKTRFVKGRLPDYFGFPAVDATDTIVQNVAVNALPFRAYAEIYNEFYRDQNLEDKLVFSKGEGAHTNAEVQTLTTVRNRPYEKDYFTSALPWPQRGADVTIAGDVKYKPVSTIHDQLGGLIDGEGQQGLDYNNAGGLDDSHVGTNGPLQLQNIESLGITIEELRQSSRLQEWLEANARGGSRLTEVILQHFGVISKDSRLQRPEFLGGGRQPLTISEVLQTSRTDQDQTPLGTLAGHGISVGMTNTFKRRFTEHGFVLGITSIIPRTAYQQGVERFFTKPDRLAYYWPKFAQLGEQPILNQEIYYDWLDNSIDENGLKQALQTWAYQSRYAEYKYNKSKISGDFRDTLSYWHLGRIFESMPSLNNDFVKAKSADMDRIFAVTDPTLDKIQLQVYNNVKALRPIPYFNIPKL